MGKLNKSLMILMVSLAMMIAGGALAAPGVHTDPAAPAAVVGETPDAAHGVVTDGAVADPHAAEAAGTEAHEKKAGLPQLDPTWFPSQIFWLLVTFGVMYIGFSTKILPKIGKTIENREQHIKNDLDTARTLKEQAEAAQQKYEELMSGAFQQSWKMMEESETEIKANYDKAMSEFRKKSADQVSDLEKQIVATKKKAKSDMHDIAAEVASAAAKKIVGIDTDISQVRDVVKNIDKKAA